MGKQKTGSNKSAWRKPDGTSVVVVKPIKVRDDKQAREITREAKMLYSMMTLLHCANDIKKYLVTSANVSPRVRGLMNKHFEAFQRLKTDIDFNMPQDHREMWNKEWERDYLSFSAVLEIMADLSDEDRDKVERVAKLLLHKKIDVVREFDPNDVTTVGGKLSICYK